MRKYIVTHGIRIAKDFVPETFGRLTTIGPIFRVSRRHRQVCLCECGEIVCCSVSHLVHKNTISCGCFRKEHTKATKTTHGYSSMQGFSNWAHMISRCHNSADDGYSYYGAKGIFVHAEWHDPSSGFPLFMQHIGPMPSPQHSIDRFPNPDGNYEPGNVRWATKGQQSLNKSSLLLIEYQGKKQTMTEWGRELGIHPTTLVYRYKKGKPLCEVFSPVKECFSRRKRRNETVT